MPETQSGGPMTIRTLLVVLSTLLTAIAPPADAMTLAQARALYLEVVQQHDTRALDHLAHVARQGDPVAQFALGTMYEYGKGVTQSLPTAVHLFQLAARQGFARAQSSLGVMYQYGKGVTQSLPTAVHLYQLAAQQGYPRAQCNLGTMYESGKGVTQSFPTAVHLFQLAARQGFAQAQYNLGVMYAYGKGVTQSLPTAVHWFKLAAMQRYEPAIQALHALQQQMTQTAHAQPVRTATVAVAPRVSAAAPPVAPPVHDSQQQLQNLQQFWTLYFQAAHAHLVDFGAPALVQPVGFAAAQP